MFIIEIEDILQWRPVGAGKGRERKWKHKNEHLRLKGTWDNEGEDWRKAR